MRHKGVNKEETRKKIIAAVGRCFRKHGYAGIGVDGLAKNAGVTSGAFYSHLGSKDRAFMVALTAGLDEVIEGIPNFQREYGEDWVKEFVTYYLSKAHRSDLDCGCAMATLTPEVVRFGQEIQSIYEEKMTRIVDLVAQGFAGRTDQDQRARAWSMMGVLIGGISVARAMQSEKLSEEISEAIKAAAIRAAGPVRNVTQTNDRPADTESG